MRPPEVIRASWITAETAIRSWTRPMIRSSRASMRSRAPPIRAAASSVRAPVSSAGVTAVVPVVPVVLLMVVTPGGVTAPGARRPGHARRPGPAGPGRLERCLSVDQAARPWQPHGPDAIGKDEGRVLTHGHSMAPARRPPQNGARILRRDARRSRDATCTDREAPAPSPARRRGRARPVESEEPTPFTTAGRPPPCQQHPRRPRRHGRRGPRRRLRRAVRPAHRPPCP